MIKGHRKFYSLVLTVLLTGCATSAHVAEPSTDSAVFVGFITFMVNPQGHLRADMSVIAPAVSYYVKNGHWPAGIEELKAYAISFPEDTVMLSKTLAVSNVCVSMESGYADGHLVIQLEQTIGEQKDRFKKEIRLQKPGMLDGNQVQLSIEYVKPLPMRMSYKGELTDILRNPPKTHIEVPAAVQKAINNS